MNPLNINKWSKTFFCHWPLVISHQRNLLTKQPLQFATSQRTTKKKTGIRQRRSFPYLGFKTLRLPSTKFSRNLFSSSCHCHLSWNLLTARWNMTRSYWHQTWNLCKVPHHRSEKQQEARRNWQCPGKTRSHWPL